MHPLARLDHAHLWHPFTQMRDWLGREPVVIVSGKGARLRDARGRAYLDANSSIWTNLHGHRHPAIDAALRSQLKRIAHSSALGLANEPAARLGAELVRLANPGPRRPEHPGRAGRRPGATVAGRVPRLARVFFSDDGSTAMEVALKLAHEFARRSGRCRKPKFLSLSGAYHGDTLGAVSLGHIDLFHKSWSGLLFRSDTVMAPYCYRCPFNRARPERADAREYRRCRWECLGRLEQKFAARRKRGEPYAALVVEPLIQGAAGMIAHPEGWLRQAAEMARAAGTPWIADEVMTAFGRTGGTNLSPLTSHLSPRNSGLAPRPSPLAPHFACHREGVQPDFLVLAKGLTGGYLPMAATLTTQPVFEAFLGEYEEFKTFFHGHSYTANPLGAAAALASLKILQSRESLRDRTSLEDALRRELPRLWALPNVGDVRQVGLVAGVELVSDWRTRRPFDLKARAGIRVCEAMARRGVLTRPIGNVVVLMPPYCTTPAQAARMVGALHDGIVEVFGKQRI